MTRLKKSAMIGLVMMISFLFRAGTAQAQIPVPTIGAELATQISQLTEYIEELKKVKGQIEENIKQAKAFGDSLSLDGIKGLIQQQAMSALNGKLATVRIPQAFQDMGFSEDTLKDPSKITENLDRIQEELHGKFDQEKLDKCQKARKSMYAETTKVSLANSLAVQNMIASGEGIQDIADANSDVSDVMQALGAQSAALAQTYQRVSSSALMQATSTVNGAIEHLCD